MRGDEFFAQIAVRAPFTKLHPRVAGFFKGYLAKERVVAFGGRSVVNTHFPPYPSPAFDRLAEQFSELGSAATRRLYSVTLAVTNRCTFHCWHCYNAGRNQVDTPLEVLQRLAGELQNLGAVMVTLTGGEPLLRDDLPDIAGAFDSRSCLLLGTTGEGLTAARADQLHATGLFGVGISLDSDREPEHDRLRGKPGAFRTVLDALGAAQKAGLYPYVVAVASRELLRRDRFLPFLRFAGEAGAWEVHLLEPSATGRLAGRSDILLSPAERNLIFAYQAEVAGDETLPLLSSFAYLESGEAFGCGAGLTHLYIDGSGEVCPCNLVPLSFGNLTREPIARILERMGRYFQEPRTVCVGQCLNRHLPTRGLPLTPDQSETVCRQHLPATHPLPAFFRIHKETAGATVGQLELREAYDRVHADYDTHWLSEAARPVEELVRQVHWQGTERVFEAGCGTGYATALLASRAASVLAVDLSEGMVSEARARLAAKGSSNVDFRVGDALTTLRTAGLFDAVFSSWVLGYIPLEPLFAAAYAALVPAGYLAFLVHRENSPREPTEAFAELVAADPTVLQKRVTFDFPRDAVRVGSLLQAAGFTVETLKEGDIVFKYASAAQVLEHLLKSGAGTAFYDAIDPARRDMLTGRFLALLERRHDPSTDFEVRHEYVSCAAHK